MFNMSELPPKVGEWLAAGERVEDHHEAYLWMLQEALDGAEGGRLELRCRFDGYLRLERELPYRLISYRAWRVFAAWRQFRFMLRAAVLRKCPQCRFDMKVRGR